MALPNFSRFINEDVAYTRDKTRVIAKLTSYDSAPYTRLANNIKRLGELEADVKKIKEEIKDDTRTHVTALFQAEDAILTRIVETVSLTLSLSKDPKPTETIKYAKVIEELAKSFTPELILKLETLKKEYTTVTQKLASITLSEGVKEVWAKIKERTQSFLARIKSWGESYDKRLAALKKKSKLNESVEIDEVSDAGLAAMKLMAQGKGPEAELAAERYQKLTGKSATASHPAFNKTTNNNQYQSSWVYDIYEVLLKIESFMHNEGFVGFVFDDEKRDDILKQYKINKILYFKYMDYPSLRTYFDTKNMLFGVYKLDSNNKRIDISSGYMRSKELRDLKIDDLEKYLLPHLRKAIKEHTWD